MRTLSPLGLVIALLALLPGCAQPLPSPGGGYYYADATGADSGGAYPDGGGDPSLDGAQANTGGTDAATTDAGSTGGADAGKTDAKPTTSAMTVAACPDGKFSETPPNLSASLQDAIAKFDPANGSKFVQEALAIRYPLGATILQNGAKTPMGGGKTCVDVFFQAAQGKTPSGALGQASTLVHECGHVYDQSVSQFGSHTYFVNESVKFTCSGLSYQGANAGFARSRIKGDGFDATWPPCAKFGDQGCDGYAPIYLSGNPDDAQFDSGDQGYDMLLEEVNQYVNSLVTDYAFADQQQWSVSAEDGILTLSWYMERYLHMARLKYPEAYAYLLGDACWRQATLTVWGRAWTYLEKSNGNGKLNLKGAMLRKLVTDPVLLDEIQRLRVAEGCGGK